MKWVEAGGRGPCDLACVLDERDDQDEQGLGCGSAQSGAGDVRLWC